MSEKPTREETTNARRKHIVEVAAACFIAKGFHQTSIRDIARSAGVSLGNIYNHFPGKTEVIAEIASLEAAQIDAFGSMFEKNGKDPHKALDQFLKAYLKTCSAPSHAALTLEILAEAIRQPEITVGFMENREKLLAGLEGLIGQLRNSERTESNLSDRDAAEFVLDLIEGVGMRVFFEERKPAKRDHQKLHLAISKLCS